MKVVSNTAISLDGRINTRERRFAFFGSERDHARMSRLRAEADAVLVGTSASDVDGTGERLYAPERFGHDVEREPPAAVLDDRQADPRDRHGAAHLGDDAALDDEPAVLERHHLPHLTHEPREHA